jgi:dTDP-4-dehydrorhamnose 3,5-epimerase
MHSTHFFHSPGVEVPDFLAGPIDDVIVRDLKFHSDSRGWLTELYREDEAPADALPVMAYVSQTAPGVQRGPHEHVEQSDYFAFLGPGDFWVKLWDARPESATFGRTMSVVLGESRPATLLVPPGVVHAYKNVSSYAGWVFNAPNRLFAGPGKRGPVDEIRHEDRPDSPYVFED